MKKEELSELYINKSGKLCMMIETTEAVVKGYFVTPFGTLTYNLIA